MNQMMQLIIKSALHWYITLVESIQITIVHLFSIDEEYLGIGFNQSKLDRYPCFAHWHRSFDAYQHELHSNLVG